MSHEHAFACRLAWVGAASGPTTSYASYSRELELEVFGKPTLLASAAQAFRGDAALWNPEDMLMASLSACHCLSYLALAARTGIVVAGYRDEATGTMKLVDGVIRFTRVLLHPKVKVAAGTNLEKARALHAKAHQECFIAASVNFPVDHEPEVVVGASDASR